MRKDRKTNGKPSDSYEKRLEKYGKASDSNEKKWKPLVNHKIPMGKDLKISGKPSDSHEKR